MTGRRSRRKGHEYERKVSNEFREWGFRDCITSRNGDRSRDAAKVDLCNTDPWNVQCKAVESGINYHRLLSEMPKDGNINIVFHKKQRQEIVAMTKQDFYQLINNGKTTK